MERHHVWRYAGLACLLLVFVPTATAAILWWLGIGRDVDMSGPGELVIPVILASLVPAGVLAFAVLAPLAIGLDRVVRGVTSRFVNLLIGASLSLPLVGLGLLGPPRRGLTPVGIALVGALPLAGMLVGLGLRHRRRRST